MYDFTARPLAGKKGSSSASLTNIASPMAARRHFVVSVLRLR